MLLCVCLASGCASMRPEQFAAATPRFDPIHYFEGPTRSWGVIESRAGEPRSTFRATMMGVPDADGARRDGLTITQDFTYDDGRKQQRVWHIKRIDEHRFDATSSDVVGIATGYAWGNTFRWEYTLQLKAGNPLTRVRMKHWMYLTDDGETMIESVRFRSKQDYQALADDPEQDRWWRERFAPLLTSEPTWVDGTWLDR